MLLVTAIAIKATSRGPVFFRQKRLGINGTEFSILKFRSMYADAEQRRQELLELNEQDGGGVLFKIRARPAHHPVGRWIRKFSIDELPQLVHVVTGTMSLVGPRPLAAIDSTYTGSARRRLLVRPGVTGLWQISGRSETTLGRRGADGPVLRRELESRAGPQHPASHGLRRARPERGRTDDGRRILRAGTPTPVCRTPGSAQL